MWRTGTTQMHCKLGQVGMRIGWHQVRQECQECSSKDVHCWLRRGAAAVGCAPTMHGPGLRVKRAGGG